MTFGNFLSPNIATWPFDKRKADDENEERDRAEEHGEGVWPGAHRQQLSVCASQRAPFIINYLPAPWSTDPCGQRETGLAGKLGKKRASPHPSLPEIGLPSLMILLAKPISLHIRQHVQNVWPSLYNCYRESHPETVPFFYRTQVRSFPWLVSMPPKMRRRGSLTR